MVPCFQTDLVSSWGNKQNTHAWSIDAWSLQDDQFSQISNCRLECQYYCLWASLWAHLFHLIVTRFTLCSPSFLEDLVLLVLRLNIHQTWKVCFRSHTVGRIAVASWPRTLLSTEINGSTPVLQDNLRNSYSQMDSGFDFSICPLPINDEWFVESGFFFGGSTFATAIAFNHVFVCKMFNVFKKVYQNRQLSSGWSSLYYHFCTIGDIQVWIIISVILWYSTCLLLVLGASVYWINMQNFVRFRRTVLVSKVPFIQDFNDWILVGPTNGQCFI
jgi:hypothetical protein